MSIAQLIDHTILKPTTTLADIEKICEEGLEYGFATVCIPPYFVQDAAGIIKDAPLGITTVIGFPFGYSHYKAKVVETAQALEDGATDIDLVMNSAAFKSNDLLYLETEIREISGLVAQKREAVLKVIIESGNLTEEEIIRCCELYQHFPVHFLKTSTGYAEKGASVQDVRTMRRHLPSSIQIKASGGIRNYETAKAMVDAGATRLGCSSSIAIVKGGEGSGAY